MTDDEIDAVARRLKDPDWLVRCLAIRGCHKEGKRAVPLLPAIFDLCFDAKAPARSDAFQEIRNFGVFALPFLLRQAESPEDARRAQALSLLEETGDRNSTWVRLVEQVLPPRRLPWPDWGDYRDEVLAMFRKRLGDPALTVRFAAAGALEEFGLSLPETIPVFIDVLRHGIPHAQNWAALRLGRIGPAAAAAAADLARLAELPSCEGPYWDRRDEEHRRHAAANAYRAVSGASS